MEKGKKKHKWARKPRSLHYAGMINEISATFERLLSVREILKRLMNLDGLIPILVIELVDALRHRSLTIAGLAHSELEHCLRRSLT